MGSTGRAAAHGIARTAAGLFTLLAGLALIGGGSAIDLASAGPIPEGAEDEFSTDFSRHTIPFDEILSGGPPKDGIPAIDQPAFVTVAEAGAWLDASEPVVLVEIAGDARAYPIQIMMWHEIVNDEVAGVPVTVTFCPLCNTAIAFAREVGARVLDFGTSGRLRLSNMVMYDRQTESWWQQATGEAIVDGRDVGTAGVFSRALGDTVLDFVCEGGAIVDAATRSEWNALGVAVAGDFAGRRLSPVVSVNHFWFSWAAFRPATRIYGP